MFARSTVWGVVASLALGLAYAVIRYVTLGPVPVHEVPLYVSNKAISVAGLGLIALGFAAGPFRRRSARFAALEPRELGKAGLGLIALHVVLSLALLDPAHFPKLFEGARYNLLGGLALLAGGLGLLALLALDRMPNLGPGDPGRAQMTTLARLVLWATLVHLVALGGPGWLRPETWHGGLPPITLIGAVLTLAALLVPRRGASRA